MILAGDFIPKTSPVSLPSSFGDRTILANLEGPVCVGDLPESGKVGVCLRSSRFNLDGKWAFSLANNHMMDCREAGLSQTREFLKKNGWSFAGAGDDVAEAREPMFLSENGCRIAVFSCCERQFGVASWDEAGVAEKGEWLFLAVRRLKEDRIADFVIVSCHAAAEFSPWVSPRLRSFYHSLIDAGADVIHGHHSHVPQGYEEYHGHPIFYGLGNFVIDPSHWGGNPNYFWSLIAKIDFSPGRLQWVVEPFEVRKGENAIEVVQANGHNRDGYLEYLQGANLPFQSEDFLEGCWQEASIRLFNTLYGSVLRSPPLQSRKLSGKERMKMVYFASRDILHALLGRELPYAKGVKYGKALFNYFNCESHSEMIQTALGVRSGILSDKRSPIISAQADDLKIGVIV